jgi:uncharacterized membrane protein YedE/YeeE
MKRIHLVAFVSGVLFAVGLGLSGMTQPTKVIAFLDVSGPWDPTLAFVMVGAIVVHMGIARRATRPAARPLLAQRFMLPPTTRIDGKLVTGATLFGLGWGAAGFCPGPALVSLVSLSWTPMLFVAAMLAGMLLYTAIMTPRRAEDPGASTGASRGGHGVHPTRLPSPQHAHLGDDRARGDPAR